MAGAPSQVDLFDNKPLLQKHDGQEIPPGFIPEGERFAFVKGTPRLLGSPFNVHAARASRRGNLRAPPPPGRPRGRNRRDPIDEDDAVQSCAGADFHEHWPPDHRSPEPGILAVVWAWQRQQGPACVRRVDLGSEQPGRRQELLGQRVSADRAPGRRVPRRRANRCCSRRIRPASTPARDASRWISSTASTNRTRSARRPRDRHADRRLRDGVPDADERPRADRYLVGTGEDPRDVRHGARAGLVREQLPARPAADRARRPLRAALPPRLGHHGASDRHGHRRARAAAVPRDRSADRGAAHGPEAARAARRRRWSSGAASSAARRSTRRETDRSCWAATTIRVRSRCGWPAAA